jgi:hypothetical protein
VVSGFWFVWGFGVLVFFGFGFGVLGFVWGFGDFSGGLFGFSFD